MTNAYESYLEATVMSADPVELIVMLYRGGEEAVRRARQAMADGDIRGRAKEITKASEILNELALSLDHRQGGEFSRNLAELYDYMQRRLIEANTQQRPEPLAEVERLLTTLREGWDSARASVRATGQTPVPSYSQPLYGDFSGDYSPVSLTA